MPLPSNIGEAVRSCLVNPQLMEVLKALLDNDDRTAIETIRAAPGAGHPTALEAEQVLRHNERFRWWFRAALKENEKDPFSA